MMYGKGELPDFSLVQWYDCTTILSQLAVIQLISIWNWILPSQNVPPPKKISECPPKGPFENGKDCLPTVIISGDMLVFGGVKSHFKVWWDMMAISDGFSVATCLLPVRFGATHGSGAWPREGRRGVQNESNLQGETELVDAGTW